MRTRRIYGLGESVVYHCVTRTVNGEMWFGEQEKEVLRRMLHRVADFSGVELLTYAVMSNHVHVLVRVNAAAKAVSDEELLRRFKVLYPKPSPYRMEDPGVVAQLLRENTEEGQRLRTRLKARMGDVSQFMKTLNLRSARWFNKLHQRFGPLWCDRFKSTIIEDAPEVLRTVAAYIDLNPIRAGLVDDPKDYRFCGYAEALAGHAGLRGAICGFWGMGDADAEEALARYRMVIYGKGALPKRDGSGAALSQSAARDVMEVGGHLPIHTLVTQRIKYFTRGAVLGTAAFVAAHIGSWSPAIGDRRERKPVALAEDTSDTLHSFRRCYDV